jgi:hypothetical protein
VIVCGGFHKNGGMDKANWHLAHHLLETGRPVHLVGHIIDAALVNHPLATVHRVPRPLQSYLLGSPILDIKARSVWRQVKKRWPGARIIANGSNCFSGDINWSHYVNAAWNPVLEDAPIAQRLRLSLEHRRACARERIAYQKSKLIICNSERTKRDILSCTRGCIRDARTIYLGSDDEFRPVTFAEREAARKELNVAEGRRVAVFVGGLGHDNRKGFDVLCQAWTQLCEDASWDVDLVVAGSGPAFQKWAAAIGNRALSERIRLLGFSRNVPGILAAADVLVSVPRYEPYGLNVQEALSRGLASITSADAGIAERFPRALLGMLVRDPGDAKDCIRTLRFWRQNADELGGEYETLGRSLSARSWQVMAKEMIDCIQSAGDCDRSQVPSPQQFVAPASACSDRT